MISLNEHQIYDKLGEEGFTALVAAFYRRVRTDDILGPMYPKDDLDGAETRLRDFLIYRFGGPARYIEQRGHPRLRIRHMPFVINAAAAERWLSLMTDAMQEAQTPPDVQAVLTPFFTQTAHHMRNQPETTP